MEHLLITQSMAKLNRNRKNLCKSYTVKGSDGFVKETNQFISQIKSSIAKDFSMARVAAAEDANPLELAF